MTMLAVTVAEYEARIRIYKEQAVSGFLGIGRTLNEAQASGAVPRGEWESWVERTTGMAIRQAQRCMQAAREIQPGSALEKLDMSKAILLLSSGLDEEQREETARKAAEEGTSVRALKEEIKQLKLKVVEGSGAAADMRKALQKAEAEKAEAVRQAEALNEGMKERLDAAKGEAYRRGQQDKAEGMEAEIRESVRKEYAGKLEFLNGKNKALEHQKEDLGRMLEAERKIKREKWDDAYNAGVAWAQGKQAESDQEWKDSQAAMEAELVKWQDKANGAELDLVDKEKQIDRLNEMLEAEKEKAESARKKLEAAEEREIRRARELQELKKEKAMAGMEAARGVRAETGLDLAAAVRSFIGAAGVLPQMGSQIARMSEKEKAAIRTQVETVAEWVRNSRAVLEAVAAEGSVQ